MYRSTTGFLKVTFTSDGSSTYSGFTGAWSLSGACATQGKGALSSGTLTLAVHAGQTVTAGTRYAFSFTITNPAYAQNAGTVTIQASGTAGFASAAMSTDIADVLGVTDGGKPIHVVCPTGMYSPTEGASNCLDCPAGTYSPTEGASNCLDCPAGTCVTSVPHAYSYSPHVSWFCAGGGVHVHLLLHGGHILERRCVESVPAALPPFPRTP